MWTDLILIIVLTQDLALARSCTQRLARTCPLKGDSEGFDVHVVFMVTRKQTKPFTSVGIDYSLILALI